MRKEVIGLATLYQGDCMEILPSLPPFDVVITDPVYPVLDYGWKYVPIENFGFQCRQFYFWMQPPVAFPLAIWELPYPTLGKGGGSCRSKHIPAGLASSSRFRK